MRSRDDTDREDESNIDRQLTGLPMRESAIALPGSPIDVDAMDMSMDLIEGGTERRGKSSAGDSILRKPARRKQGGVLAQ